MSRIYRASITADGTLILPLGVREELGGTPLRHVTFLIRNGAVYLAPSPIGPSEETDSSSFPTKPPIETNPGSASPMRDESRNELP